jgi:hypothetical protein
MLARMMLRRLRGASLLVGLGLITAACGVSAPASGITSPKQSPAPSPTATMAISSTATSDVLAGCSDPSSNVVYNFENPPGSLPISIPLPSSTLVDNHGQGIQAGSVNYTLCSPTMASAAITAYMDSALPAAGWLQNSVPACDHAHGYPWYKGNYGIEIDVNTNTSMPHIWAIQLCPHVGEG